MNAHKWLNNFHLWPKWHRKGWKKRPSRNKWNKLENSFNKTYTVHSKEQNHSMRLVLVCLQSSCCVSPCLFSKLSQNLLVRSVPSVPDKRFFSYIEQYRKHRRWREEWYFTEIFIRTLQAETLVTPPDPQTLAKQTFTNQIISACCLQHLWGVFIVYSDLIQFCFQHFLPYHTHAGVTFRSGVMEEYIIKDLTYIILGRNSWLHGEFKAGKVEETE